MPDWREILSEINRRVVSDGAAFDLVRRKYLKQLYKLTGRNVIAYYSGWLAKRQPQLQGQLEISDDDKNGFMMAVNKLDRSKGLDLILHTPGGTLSAAQSIVHYLQTMFKKNIRAIVPQISMSAGTIIACSCKEILMSKHSNLGPIDPQFGGIAAAGVKEEFERAIREITADPNTIHLWRTIIGQYRPTFLSQCENAVRMSKDFVRQQLQDVMFEGDSGGALKAKTITDALSDFTANKGHDRHIHADDCISLGLKVRMIESDPKLQDLVLTIHHCFMHQTTNSNAFKVIENHLGAAMIKQAQVQVVVQK